MQKEHLLVVRFSAIGDILMTVPVVEALAKQYPHLHITVLSVPYAKTFFEHLPNNVSFMGANIKKEYKGIFGLNSLYRRLHGKRFTAVADLHDVLRTKYLRLKFWLDGIKTAHINKHRKEKKALTARNNKRFKQLNTSFQNYADVLAQVGYPIKMQLETKYLPYEAPLNTLPEAFVKHFKTAQQHIGIAPFAAHKGKIYPIEKTEKVIALLAQQIENLQIYLFGGGEQEIKTLETLANKYPHCICVPNKLKGFSQEMVLINHLSVMITMDSSNMHLAALAGTKVVSVWGATHPFAGFMPYNQSKEQVVQASLPCRPCSVYGNKPCYRKDFACMNLISPEMITNKVKSILANSGNK